MIKYFFTNSVGILLSRILGFIRDIVSANILGASMYSDIFFTAFKIPNLFRKIFADGSFSQTFLPFFTQSKNKVLFTSFLFYKFLLIILFISIVINIFPNIITSIFVYGFSQEAKMLTSQLLKIQFYYLDMIFIVMLFSAILHHKNHFATTSFSTSLLNISLIVSMLYSSTQPKVEIITNMSYGVLIGGAFQIILHLFVLKKLNLFKTFTYSYMLIKKKYIKIKADIDKFNSSFVYSILGNSSFHISSLLDTFLASFLISGSISYLYYANRVFQFPMALFSIALSIAIFPTISKLINKGKSDEALLAIKKSFYFLSILLGLATVVGIIFSQEIIYILFQRGVFHQEDTIVTANLLSLYLIGLLPFGLSKVFSVWLFVKKLHKVVAKISMYSILINIVLSLALFLNFKIYAIVLASSLSGFVLLFFTIKEFGFYRFKSFIDLKVFVVFVSFILFVVFVSLELKSYLQYLLQI